MRRRSGRRFARVHGRSAVVMGKWCSASRGRFLRRLHCGVTAKCRHPVAGDRLRIGVGVTNVVDAAIGSRILLCRQGFETITVSHLNAVFIMM